MEVLLVVTLLAVVAAVAAPSLTGGMARSRMDRAAQELLGAWHEARLEAISQGRVLCFQGVVGSNRFSIGRVSGAGEASAAVWAEAAAADDETPNARGPAAAEEQLTAAGIVFSRVLVAASPGDPPLGASIEEGALSPGVLFRPDGTSSDAEALLEDADGRTIRVVLRGLTGAASVQEDE